LEGPMMDSPSDLVASLETFAKTLGFIEVGFSRPQRPTFFDSFMSRLAEKKHGDMTWLEKNIDLREDPSTLLAGCRTILSLAYPYPNTRHETEDGFWVARYADPSREDYHFRLRKLGEHVGGWIQKAYPGSLTKVFVDSAPILEKSLAWQAGIGFMGKNTLMIIPGYGSYFFLVEVLTTAPLQTPDVQPLPDSCGACSLCMEACPTAALEEPYRLNASKCLAYLTIEFKGEIDLASGRKMGNCFLGCDQCQEVCPYNKGIPSARVSLPSTEEILNMDEGQFKRRFGKTSLARPGLEKIKSNVRAVRG